MEFGIKQYTVAINMNNDLITAVVFSSVDMLFIFPNPGGRQSCR